MTDQKACALCGAGGHLAADCQWGHAIAGDILAKLPKHAAGRTGVENILDVMAAIRETELGHRSYADIDEALLNVEYDLSFARCKSDLASAQHNVANAQMSLHAVRYFLQGLILQRDNALADLAGQVPTQLELTEDLQSILGRQCFTLIHFAQALRHMGHDIDRKAEAEQAACIHWMLNHYLAHGSEWKAHAEAELKAVAPQPAMGG